MPQWQEAPEQVAKTSFEKTLAIMNNKVAGSPSLEAVTGFTFEQLFSHAVDAIDSWLHFEPDVTEQGYQTNPAPMIRAYVLGFIVGMEYRREAVVPPPPNDDGGTSHEEE